MNVIVKKNAKLLLFFLVPLLFVACPNNGNGPGKEIPGEEIPLVLHWTFHDEIPGWEVFDTNRTPDYPAGTTMNIDAVLPDGMTLKASDRTTRWVPAHPAPADTDFSDGYIQPNGATAAGKYFLVIENVTGPFKLTINYTARESQKSIPVIFIDDEEQKRGDEANGDSNPQSVYYEYFDSDTVTIQLGNVNGGIRIYDVILVIEGGSGEPVLVSSIAINEGDFSLIEDTMRQLSVNVLPGTASNKKVDWSSDDTDVAAVSSAGLVTAVAEGTAIITAAARDGSGRSGSVTVTVESSWNGDPGNPWALDPNLQVLKAFPGAEGYGQKVSGGRKGKVVAVTSLDDAATNPPTGSLRWALAQHTGEPITVMFRVSGLIELQGNLRVQRNNFTLAGQTAPGDGICIMGGKVNLGGSNNFIIRHLRFRVGTMNGDPNGESSIGIENASNFIIDHCTFGWSGEENTTIYDNKMTTVQWCIVHEGLYQSGHNKGVRGYGTQWGGETATYHHNLLAHNDSRSPRFNGARSNDKDVLIDFVNNVNYNWGREGSSYGGEIETNSHRVNFVNNYYKPGPARPGTDSSHFVDVYYASSATPPQGNKIALWYMSGNVMEGSANTGKTADNYSGLYISRYPVGTSIEQLKSATRFAAPLVTTESAQDAYNSVLAKAGAFPRDSVDARIVQEVRTGTASFTGTSGKPGIIDDPAAVGGYPVYSSLPAPTDTDGDGIPDAWETANGLNPEDPADGALKNLSRAYTNLEVYLYDLARNRE